MTKAAYSGWTLQTVDTERFHGSRARWERVEYALVWLLVFAIPWGDMVLLPSDVQASRVFTVVAALIWFASIWRGNPVRSFGAAHWFMLLYVCWSAANILWTQEADRSLRRALSYSQLFLTAWLVYQCAASGKRFRGLLSAYVAGCYVGFGGLAYNFLNEISQGDGRYTAPGFDPNDLAVTLVLGVPLAWYAALHGRRGAWFHRIYIPCACIAALLTASRSGLVTLAVCAIFPLCAMPRTSLRALVSLILLALTTVFTVTWFWNDISVRRLSTIADQLTARDLNGRVDIWRRGFDAFLEQPLTGTGAGSFGMAVGARRGRDLAAHNTFLGVLVEHGLVGIAFFFGIISALLAVARRAPPLETRLWIVMLTGWGIAVMALSWENRELTWVLWGLCAAQPWRAARKPARSDAPGEVRHVYA